MNLIREYFYENIMVVKTALRPLKIWDVMPPYLKTLFEKKTEI